MQLNERELATVLAALRLFQRIQDALFLGGMDHFADCEPLPNDDIDDLCERINCGDGDPTGGDWKVVDGEGDTNRLIVGDEDTVIADCYPDSAERLALPPDYQKNAFQIVACRDLVRELAGAEVLGADAADRLKHLTERARMTLGHE